MTVSKGDTKAYPMENEIMAAVEKAGAKVTTASWSGESAQAEFAADVSGMEARGAAID